MFSNCLQITREEKTKCMSTLQREAMRGDSLDEEATRDRADEDKDTFCWSKRFEAPTVIAFIFSMKRALTVLVMISSWYVGWEFGKKCICLSFTSLSYKSWIFFLHDI